MKYGKIIFEKTVKGKDVVVTQFKHGVLTEVFEKNGKLVEESFIEF